MNRREFIGGFVGSSVLLPCVSRAQLSSKPRRIAMVAPSRPIEDLRTNPIFRAFLDELARLGFVEGQNLVVDRYSGSGHMDDYPELARSVVTRDPEAILTSGGPMTIALKAATGNIPIVAILGDPVAYGLVGSLARPGGNVTGVTIDAGIEIHGKRLGLLREMRPEASQVAYLASSKAWNQPQGAMVREAAQSSKLSVAHLDLGRDFNDAAYEAAFGSADWTKLDLLLVSDEPEHLSHTKTLVDLATSTRSPACYPFRDLVVAGGLMAYYRDLLEAFRQLAAQMAQVLSGRDPAEIPFWQPTNFRLSVNTKAAQKIRLILPQTILASADEVIE